MTKTNATPTVSTESTPLNAATGKPMGKKTKVITTTAPTAEVAKKKKKVAKTTDPSTSADKAKNLDKANMAKAAKDTVIRESIYQYPADCTSKTDKKNFRRKARAAALSFDKVIAGLKKSNTPADKTELKTQLKAQAEWKAATYA